MSNSLESSSFSIKGKSCVCFIFLVNLIGFLLNLVGFLKPESCLGFSLFSCSNSWSANISA